MIAMSSPALSLRPFQEALEFVARRFQAWEIVGEGLHFLPDVEKEFQELAPSFDLRYSAHTPLSDVNIGSLNPRMRRAALNEVLQSIAAAGRMVVRRGLGVGLIPLAIRFKIINATQNAAPTLMGLTHCWRAYLSPN
jgi:sugar phosphate isomerase/epimerase